MPPVDSAATPVVSAGILSQIVLIWLAMMPPTEVIWLTSLAPGARIMPAIVPIASSRVGILIATSKVTGSESAIAPLILTVAL